MFSDLPLVILYIFPNHRNPVIFVKKFHCFIGDFNEINGITKKRWKNLYNGQCNTAIFSGYLTFFIDQGKRFMHFLYLQEICKWKKKDNLEHKYLPDYSFGTLKINYTTT